MTGRRRPAEVSYISHELQACAYLTSVVPCRIGEGRACWSLGNAHTALGKHDQAIHFAEKHLEICKEVK